MSSTEMFTKAELIERIQGIDKRREKGLLLAMMGMIRRIRDTNRYYCPSEDGTRFYMQTFGQDGSKCTCMDNLNRGEEYKKCKHIWACIEAEERGTLLLVDKLPKECFLSVG